MNDKKTKILISTTKIIMVLCVVITIVALGYSSLNNQSDYKIKENTNNMTQLINKNEEQKTMDELTFEYYFSPNCKDCQIVEKGGIKSEFDKIEKSNKDAVILIDLPKFLNQSDESKSIQQWTTENQILQTPTLVVKYQGYPIYTYAGTDIAIFKKLLSGINPQTDEQFEKEIPEKQQYINEFTQQNIKIKSIPLIETTKS